MRHPASNNQGKTMNADEPIADVGRGGRSVRIIQDGNGHFYVERDGVHAEEACHRGTKSDAVMRAEGYRPVVEVYPELHERPRAPAGVELDDLYVSVSTPRG
jgi:hypothetical protein